jgi:hypothetical protein
VAGVEFVDDVVSKLARAEVRLEEVKAVKADFLQTNRGVVAFEMQRDQRTLIGRFECANPSPHLALAVGDCLGNIRTALDYLVYRLTQLHSGCELDGTAYPIFQERGGYFRIFKGEMARNSGHYRVRGIRPDIAEFIERMQPYHQPEGFERDALWLLNQLCNIDKHRFLHLAASAPTETNFTVSIADPFNKAGEPSRCAIYSPVLDLLAELVGFVLDVLTDVLYVTSHLLLLALGLEVLVVGEVTGCLFDLARKLVAVATHLFDLRAVER